MKNFRAWNPVWPESDGVYVRREVDESLVRNLQAGTACSVRGQRLSGKTSAVYSALFALANDGAKWERVDLGNRPESSLLEAWRSAGERLLRAAGVDSPERALSACSTIEKVTEGLYEAMEDRLGVDGRFYAFLDEADSFVHRFPPDDVWWWLASLRTRVQSGPSPVVWVLASLRPVAWFVDPDISGLNLDFASDHWVHPFPNEEGTWNQLSSQGFPLDDPDLLHPLLREVLDFTGGQAQLTSAVLNALQEAPDLAARSKRFAVIKDDVLAGRPTALQGHLDGVSGQLLAEAGLTSRLLSLYERVLAGERIAPGEDGGPSADYLVNMGLLRVHDGRFDVANEVYRARLREGWTREIWARHQVTRQRSRGRQRFTPGQRRVAILTTGGTMGMVTVGSRSTFDGAAEIIERRGREALQEVAGVGRWEVLEELDGINVTPAEWLKFARWIHEHRNDYDGFVLCHGTDTLAWTASALSFMLGRSVDKPVVVTGSQATVSISHGDMLDNLLRSCFVAAHPDAPREVQVQFGNAVYRAVRVEKADDRLVLGFRSPGWPELAQVSEELLVNRYALGGRPTSNEDLGFQPHIASDILVVPIVPGMHVRHFDALLPGGTSDARVDGVIVHTPGAGNIPSREGYNYRDVIRRAVDLGVPVLVTSQVPINTYTQAQYEASTAVTDFGAMLAGNMTLPAAHAKLVWVIGCVNHEGLTGDARIDAIRRRMSRNFQGEQAEGPRSVAARP